MLKVGYSLEPTLNHNLMIKSGTLFVPTDFIVKPRGSRSGGQHYMLTQEGNEASGYLYKRQKLARTLAKARRIIKRLPAAEQKAATQAQLSVARRQEKIAADRMLRRLRRARIEARHIKYTVQM